MQVSVSMPEFEQIFGGCATGEERRSPGYNDAMMRFQLRSLAMISIAAPPVLAGLWWIREEITSLIIDAPQILAVTAIVQSGAFLIGGIVGVGLAAVMWLLGYGHPRSPE
jgi:hypothetical protein